ncbi:uncharacterized protein LOC128298480 [Anopheles moucheti]|uniref:uncharacterized protein LOC128298480 n=1 Tax=Anopheles moucheti TaxID=186751 RepID=UPI0022F0453A|nr:uncharacterized protein LOC128298480 [Anopheles moucheti]
MLELEVEIPARCSECQREEVQASTVMDASTSSAPRRVLKTTSDEDRQRIITAYESGATPASIGNMLNINKSTVYGIIKRYKDTWQIESKKRGGHRAKSLSSEAVDSIRVWIDEDCTLTLKALAEKVFQQYGVRVAASTIAKEVKEFNYSFKMIQRVPERRNTAATIEERTAYAARFYDIAREVPVNGLVYLDEVGFNVSMRTSKALPILIAGSF